MSLFKYLGQVFGFYQENPIVSDATCVICLNPITDGGRIDCCKHTFCFDCIKKWSEKSSHCPACRRSFSYITRCKVYKDEKEFSETYAIDSEELKNTIPSRISINDVGSVYGDGSLSPKVERYPGTTGKLKKHYSSRW